ncbi:MAG: UDP-N-acetylmuramate--alanine ligase [Elusimicrobiota bacterium]
MAKYYFCGIAGSGMSALAQIVRFDGNQVSGSDRSFDSGDMKDIEKKLRNMGINIYAQDGFNISRDIDCFVISTAVEDSNPEILEAKKKALNIIHRSNLLSEYVNKFKTIAVGGTSGKTTTTAMIFDILNFSGFSPSIINGGYLNSLISDKLIGNAFKGNGGFLVIEADESDSTIKKYYPEIGVLLNISKDHKSVEELKKIFEEFASNCNIVFANERDEFLLDILKDKKNINFFGPESASLKIIESRMFYSRFLAYSNEFYIPFGGFHNIENALAAISVSMHLGVKPSLISKAIEQFKGTFRRFNIIGNKNGVTVIDDYAHNPAKISAMVKTLTQDKQRRLILIYQPHGFAPTRMFKNDLINLFLSYLREDDILLMPEIYYAGGSVIKDISSKDIVEEISKYGKNAFYFKNRDLIFDFIRKNLKAQDIIAVMGARDNSLNKFARDIFEKYVI